MKNFERRSLSDTGMFTVKSRIQFSLNGNLGVLYFFNSGCE